MMGIEAYCERNAKSQAGASLELSEDELAATIRTGIIEHKRKEWPVFVEPRDGFEVIEHNLPGEGP